MRILVKNEAAPANNGTYVVTTAGTVGVKYVLTRSSDGHHLAGAGRRVHPPSPRGRHARRHDLDGDRAPAACSHDGDHLHADPERDADRRRRHLTTRVGNLLELLFPPTSAASPQRRGLRPRSFGAGAHREVGADRDGAQPSFTISHNLGRFQYDVSRAAQQRRRRRRPDRTRLGARHAQHRGDHLPRRPDRGLSYFVRSSSNGVAASIRASSRPSSSTPASSSLPRRPSARVLTSDAVGNATWQTPAAGAQYAREIPATAPRPATPSRTTRHARRVGRRYLAGRRYSEIGCASPTRNDTPSPSPSATRRR